MLILQELNVNEILWKSGHIENLGLWTQVSDAERWTLEARV